jgi:predicted ATP-binding protein involved in virulence
MENFRIESLEINKIGAFEHIKMDFPKKTDPDKAEIHILTGENGTGKSTVLMLLASLADKSNDESIHKRIHGYKNLFTASADTQYQILVNELGDEILFNKWFAPIGKTVSKVVQNRLQIFNEDHFEYTNYAFFAYSGNRLIQTVLINGGEYVVNSPFSDAVNFRKSNDSTNFVTWILSNKTKSLIALSNGESEIHSIYSKTLKKIENAITQVIGVDIQFVLQDRPNVHVAIKLNDITIDIDALPDGIKSLISWLGDLLMRLDLIQWEKRRLDILEQNIVLFLDEIEVHLHPAWQRKILPVVQKLFKNAQIFISTHSPFVVGSVDGAWVHKLKKDGAYAVLDGEPVLSEDAESYDTILEEIFGIKERFGDEIEQKLKEFKDITKEILKGDDLRMEEWDNLISFFENQGRPDEIMALITPQVRQINRIKNQVTA